MAFFDVAHGYQNLLFLLRGPGLGVVASLRGEWNAE